MKMNKLIIGGIAAAGLALASMSVLAADMTFVNKTPNEIKVVINHTLTSPYPIPANGHLAINTDVVYGFCAATGSVSNCTATFSIGSTAVKTCSTSNKNCVATAVFNADTTDGVSQTIYNGYTDTGFAKGQPVQVITISK